MSPKSQTWGLTIKFEQREPTTNIQAKAGGNALPSLRGQESRTNWNIYNNLPPMVDASRSNYLA